MRWGWCLVILCALAAPGFSPCFAEEGPDLVRSVLARWEQASAGLLGVGPLEHRRLYEVHQASHSAHEISLLNEFRGPVLAGELAGRFEWSLEAAREGFLLVGEPVDEIERLFYKRVLISIDSETYLPQTVQFAGSGQNATSEPLAVVLGPRTEEPNLLRPAPSARPLQYASLEEKTPRRNAPVRVVEHIAEPTANRRELSAEVQRALSIWETSAQGIQSLDADIRRFTYEAQTHVEQRAVGEFSYSNSPLVRCTLKPAPIDPNERSHRRTADGAAYELMPSPAEYWQYTGSSIRFSHQPNEPQFVLDHASGDPAAVRAASHEQNETRALVIPPWDLLFRVSGRSLAERFTIQLSENEHLMTWSFIPRKRDDFGRFREMRVLLDNSTWLIAAVKFLDQRGDVEMVYTFHYTQVQTRQPADGAPQLLPIAAEPPPLLPAPRELHP